MMLAVALFYDMSQVGLNLIGTIPGGQAITFIGTVLIDVWAFLTFYIWFKLQGVSFVNPKRGITMGGAVLIEIIPILNALPAWTLAVVILFITTRGEEALEKTLSRVGGAASLVSKGAKLAGKIPGASPALKQGLNRASEEADKIAEGARGAREQLQNLPPDRKTHLETASKERTQAPPGSTPPVIAPPPAQPAGDIGAQPVFRQPPQETPQQGKGDPANETQKQKSTAYTQRQKEVFDDMRRQQGYARPMEESRERTAEEKASRQKEVLDDYKKEHGFAKPMEGSDTLPKTEEGQRKRAEAIAQRQQDIKDDMAKKGEEIHTDPVDNSQASTPKGVQPQSPTAAPRSPSAPTVQTPQHARVQTPPPKSGTQPVQPESLAKPVSQAPTNQTPSQSTQSEIGDTPPSQASPIPASPQPAEPTPSSKPSETKTPSENTQAEKSENIATPMSHRDTLSAGRAGSVGAVEEQLRTIRQNVKPAIERLQRESRAHIEKAAEEIIHKIQNGEELPDQVTSTKTSTASGAPSQHRTRHSL